MKKYTLSWGDHKLELGRRTLIMGIVNVTPDSFSDGGVFFSHEKAVEQAKNLVWEGADLLDIGGESTRPFSEPVSEEEEIRRVVPVIEKIVKTVSVPISIDTTKSEVAKRALDAGASIINDVGAMRMDPQMPDVAARAKVPVILMHMKGTPKTMQVAPEYEDLFAEIRDFLSKAVEKIVKKGVEKSNIIIDPGIGFGKTLHHNLDLIKNLEKLTPLDAPILMGPSRKMFIRNLLKKDNEKDIDPALPLVETGTQAAVAASALNGAHIIRVHNVADTVATLKIIDAVRAV